MEELLG